MDEREGRARAHARGRGWERGENDGDGGGTIERHGWVRILRRRADAAQQAADGGGVERARAGECWISANG